MKITAAAISDVLVIEPQVFGDARGFLFESFNAREFERQTGLSVSFVQDNHSRSAGNVLRGQHYQINQPQGKLIRVVAGEIFDVAVDIRENSPTFGKWAANNLSAGNKKLMWVPAGFAHGFMVLSDYAEVLYKSTDYYAPVHERCIKWDDPDIAVQWPIGNDKPLTSSRDAQGVPLKRAEIFRR